MNSITLGLKYRWVNSERILLYDVSSISSRIMMEWSNHVIEMLSMWPKGKPIQILYDLSRPKVSIPYLIITNHDIFNIGITDFGRTRVRQILIDRGNLFGRLALLVPASASGMLLKKLSKPSNPCIESHLFSDYSKAIDWLIDANSINEKFSQTRNVDESSFHQLMAQEENRGYKRIGKKLGLVYYEHTIIEVPMNHSLAIGRLNFEFNFFGDDIFFISRLHAQIEIVDGSLHIMDLDSTNGTFINGQRIQSRTHVKIEAGDEIGFAFTIVRLDYINA